MPEGPEVLHYAQMMDNVLRGQHIQSINILRGRYLNHGPPTNYNLFIEQIKTTGPLKCLGVSKKGKVIFIQFEDNWYIVSRLGLTGTWYTPDNIPTWAAMKPNLEFNCIGGKKLIYSDNLSYGTLEFVKGTEQIHRITQRIAPDIMDASTTFAVFQDRLRSSSAAKLRWLLEDAIVDQSLFISGVGNYLKSEILYDAHLLPTMIIGDLDKVQLLRLFRSIKKVCNRMTVALAKNNDDTYYKSMRIYRKDVDPRGNPVEKRKTKHGRMTYWVPAIQL